MPNVKGDTPVRAVVHRDATGNWVMSWAGGYAYDFWTDREAAERAATAVTRLLQDMDGADAELVDDALRASGLLVMARVRRPADRRRSVGPGLRSVEPAASHGESHLQHTG